MMRIRVDADPRARAFDEIPFRAAATLDGRETGW
jgi:hypothetical protein